jgi:hypothetical protein
MVTATTGKNQTLVIAWPDIREGLSRVYYRVSRDGGDTWEGPPTGLPLPMSGIDMTGLQCFMPQLSATSNGTVGCAFYSFGQTLGRGPHSINVNLSASYDDARNFPHSKTITAQGWNPDVNAPWSHGNRNLLFIGDYFGLAATDEFFIPFWTDTRTGVQEIFCARVATVEPRFITVFVPDDLFKIIHGVADDGGGIVFHGGKIIKIPPRSPLLKLFSAMEAIELGRSFGGDNGVSIQLAAVKELTDQTIALNKELQKSLRQQVTDTFANDDRSTAKKIKSQKLKIAKTGAKSKRGRRGSN